MGITPGTYKILGINREPTTICGLRLRQVRHSVQLLANRAMVTEANRRNKRHIGVTQGNRLNGICSHGPNRRSV
jgi:hypothetical protein